MKLFDILYDIAAKKSIDLENEEVDKLYDIFVINAFLCSVPDFIPIIAQIEALPLTKKSHLEFLTINLPKGRRTFTNPFPKKESVDEQRDKQLFYKHFETGTRDLKDILTSMTENEKIELKNAYRIGGE